MSEAKGELTMRILVVLDLIFLIFIAYLILHTLIAMKQGQDDFVTWFKNAVSLEYESGKTQNK